MRRNTEGLKRSAKLRTAAALEKAQAAIRRMQVEEIAIKLPHGRGPRRRIHRLALQHQTSTRSHREASRRIEDARAERYEPSTAHLAGASDRHTATPRQGSGSQQQRAQRTTGTSLWTACDTFLK